MPDSFPPLTWGPPFDERDLDALLSGDIADTPVALRQVADALAALRAEPTQAELNGEAAARAEFRALAGSLGLGPDEAARTDGLPYAEVLSALTLDGTGRRAARHRSIRGARGAGPARPARPAPARRHRAGPPGRRMGRRGGLIAAAAIGLVVAVIVVTGNLPGPMHRNGNQSAAGTPSGGRSSTGSQNVQAKSASRDPSHRATPTHAPSATPSESPASPRETPRDLCGLLYWYFANAQSSHANWPVEYALYLQLDKLAGNPSHFNLDKYCRPYVKDKFPHVVAPVPWGQSPGPQGTQNGPGGVNQGSSPGAASGVPGPGKTTSPGQ